MPVDEWQALPASSGAFGYVVEYGNGMPDPVPEPGTTVLMLGALGLLGCAAWRRRTASAGSGAAGR